MAKLFRGVFRLGLVSGMLALFTAILLRAWS